MPLGNRYQAIQGPKLGIKSQIDLAAVDNVQKPELIGVIYEVWWLNGMNESNIQEDEKQIHYMLNCSIINIIHYHYIVFFPSFLQFGKLETWRNGCIRSHKSQDKQCVKRTWRSDGISVFLNWKMILSQILLISNFKLQTETNSNLEHPQAMCPSNLHSLSSNFNSKSSSCMSFSKKNDIAAQKQLNKQLRK